VEPTGTAVCGKPPEFFTLKAKDEVAIMEAIKQNGKKALFILANKILWHNKGRSSLG